MKKLIAGNWKMNLTAGEAKSLADTISSSAEKYPQVDFLVCPAFVHIPVVRQAVRDNLAIGAQDCAATENGAHTGDVSASMLQDIGCKAVIIGHSERRANHGEKENILAQKIRQALAQDLHIIYCVGETLEQRENGKAQDIVGAQLENILTDALSSGNLTIAYEPVWAIGTGKTASTDDIAGMHSFIRGTLKEKLESGAQIRILYGGSVKPSNAGDIFTIDNVNGALIGGASLKSADFLAIAGHAHLR